MKSRMNYYQAAPDTIKALVAVEDQIKASGLELSLIELLKTPDSSNTAIGSAHLIFPSFLVIVCLRLQGKDVETSDVSTMTRGSRKSVVDRVVGQG